MRVVRLAIALAALTFAGAAQAATVVIFVEPMTFSKHTRVFDTPGPDRVLMCMEPPAVSGCTELQVKKRR